MLHHYLQPVTWGIAHRCVEDDHVQLLQECLQSIRTIYPDHRIVIVDSDSPKKDHLPQLSKKFRADIAIRINKNYECGAWKIVYEEYGSEYYCMIHDSCVLLRPIDDLFTLPVATMWCVPNTNKEWVGADDTLRAAVAKSLTATKWQIPDFFWTLVGNIIFAKAEIFEVLYNNHFFDLLPTNKFEAQCWERRLGVCLCQEGYADDLKENQIAYAASMSKRFLNRG